MPALSGLHMVQNQSSRFKQSFIKQFAEQEYRRLAAAASDAPATCATLSVVDEAGGACIGTLDVRSSFTPVGFPTGAYVANVVVAPERRRRGLGRRLVEAAKAYAAGELRSEVVYAYVDAVNDAAAQLYERCGFVPISEEGGLAPGSAVGQRILLRCQL